MLEFFQHSCAIARTTERYRPSPLARQLQNTASMRSGEDGLTLTDTCIALVVLSLALLGAGRLFAVALRSTLEARIQTSATYLAVQKLEQLRALAWTFDAQPVPQPVSDTHANLGADAFGGGGRGLGASPMDALSISRTDFADYLDARGRWVGAGATMPAAAVFIRRWQIAPSIVAPSEALVVRVLVTTPQRDRQAGRPRRRQAGEALMTTFIVRKAR